MRNEILTVEGEITNEELGSGRVQISIGPLPYPFPGPACNTISTAICEGSPIRFMHEGNQYELRISKVIPS